MSDPDRLKQVQYNNADKLAARIRLHEEFSTNQVPIQEWFFDHLLAHAPESAVLLELGCGRGDIWMKNADRIPPGWQIALTDFSEGMLSDCAAHLGELAGRFAFDVVDVQNIAYENSRFDIVIANYMLYHAPNRGRAIGEIRRVLKPSGVLLAMTNGERHMLELFDLAKQFDAAFSGKDVLSHLPFSLQNGGEQLARHFRDVQLEYFDSGLYVTEAQPLLDYIASMISLPGEAIVSQHGKALAAEIQKRIETSGGIPIQKDTGMFMATGYTNRAYQRPDGVT